MFFYPNLSNSVTKRLVARFCLSNLFYALSVRTFSFWVKTKAPLLYGFKK